MDVADRRRRQAVLLAENGVVGVEPLRRDRAKRELPEVGTDPFDDQPPILAHRGGREVALHLSQPAVEQRSDGGVRRVDLPGRHVGHQRCERALGVALGATHSAAELAVSARRRVTGQLHDQLPHPRAPLAHRSLHRSHHNRGFLDGTWMAVGAGLLRIPEIGI
jgi:hypothetical protein